MAKKTAKPQCISIIVCDDIYRDERTKKLVLVGAFSNILSTEFPCMHRKISVLFALTEENGQYDLSLRIEQEKTSAVIAEIKGH